MLSEMKRAKKITVVCKGVVLSFTKQDLMARPSFTAQNTPGNNSALFLVQESL